MSESGLSKPFGIRIDLPESDPFRANHLLGESWSTTRWYATREERDRALEGMCNQPGYYRKGDTPSVKYVEVDP
ncbi:MAG: hypothetical protein AB8B63_23610 [Granulosicoccus sp.]